MAMTKQSCYDTGRMAGETGHPGSDNPYKADSWQANAWSDGYRAGAATRQNMQARAAAEAGQGQKASDCKPAQGLPAGAVSLAPFPRRMPHVTRVHVSLLNERALGTKDSTLALRLDKKIAVLYQRYA